MQACVRVTAASPDRVSEEAVSDARGKAAAGVVVRETATAEPASIQASQKQSQSRKSLHAHMRALSPERRQ
jgi:hypothetical protein